MIDSSTTLRELSLDSRTFSYYSLPCAAEDPALAGLAHLPYSLRVIAENLLRHANASDVDGDPLVFAIVASGSTRVVR